ncbi:Zinc-finger homeodomain protein 2 [Linum grandiflorum]
MRPATAAGPTSAPINAAGGGEAGSSSSTAPVRYRECLKNQAVGIGGHAVDGCGEFMAAGEEGSLAALKCAACNCHRNFHRKEGGLGAVAGDQLIPYHHPPPPPPHPPPPPPQFSPYSYRGPPPYIHFSPSPHRPLALPPAAGSGGGGGGGGFSREEEDVSNPSSSGGGGMNTRYKKKRHRTKFTAEQKESMRRFSERLGWRIQKHDEAAVDQFCGETGIKRKVLKIWMHNNKNTLGKEP